MSIIFDALSRAGSANRARSRLLAAAPWPNGRRGRLWGFGAAMAVLGILMLALGHETYRSAHWHGSAVMAAASSAAAGATALDKSSTAEIPSMPARAEKPPETAERPRAAPPGAPTSQPGAPAVQAALPATRAAVRFEPPASLSQPLPPPGLGLSGAYLTPPPLATPIVPPPAVSRNSSVADVKSLGDLPTEIRSLVERAKVRVLVHAPQSRSRFVIVEDRQLREGDELVAGVWLEEITERGLVLRHKETRVLAPSRRSR